MKRLSGLVLLGALSLSACTSVTVDTNFATTPHGMVNSGDYKPGSLFRWDTTNSTIRYVGDVAGFAPADPNSPGRYQETTFEGQLSASAFISAVQTAALEAAIKDSTKLILRDTRRLNYPHILTKLRDALNAGGDDLLEEWGIKSAIAAGSVYYLLVNDVTFGDELELSVTSSTSAGASFPVKIGAATFNVKIDKSGLSHIKGNDTVLLFNVTVLRPAYRSDGTMTTIVFGVVDGTDLSRAAQLFRKVGQS